MKKVFLLILVIIFTYNVANSSEEVGRLLSIPTGEVNLIKSTPGDAIYASIWGEGIQVSINGADSWSPRNTGLNNLFVTDIHFANSTLGYLTTFGGGAYKTTNGGNSWVSVGLDSNMNATCVIIDPENENLVFVGTYGSGLFKSTDGGESWEGKNTSLIKDDLNETVRSLHITCLAFTTKGTLLMGTYGEGIYRSEDKAENWRRATSGTNIAKYINDLYVRDNNTILLATNGQGLFESVNDGLQWGEYQDPFESDLPDWNVTCVTYTDDAVIGTRESGLWYYNKQPYTDWRKSNFTRIGVNDITSTSNGHLYAALPVEGVLKSTNNGETWVRKSFRAGNDNNPYIKAVGQYVIAINNNKRVHRSTDYGTTWEEVLNITAPNRVLNLNYSGSKAVITMQGSVYVSTDNGSTWEQKTPLSLGQNDSYLDANYTSNGILYLSVVNVTGSMMDPVINIRLHRSTDDGNNFTQPAPSLQPGGVSSKIYISNTNDIYYYIANQQIGENSPTNILRRSTDGGVNWVTLLNYSPSEMRINTFGSNGNRIFVGTDDGLLVSTNKGDNFTEWEIPLVRPAHMTQPVADVRGLAFGGAAEVFVGLEGNFGLYRTTNNGTDWDSLNSSYSVSNMQSMTNNLDGDVYFASHGFYRRLKSNFMGVPSLVGPANGTKNLEINPTLTWNSSNKADLYQIEVSANSGFTAVRERVILSDLERDIFRNLDYNTKHYWRVRGKTNGIYSDWSTVFEFTTKLAPPILVSPENETKAVPHFAEFYWNPVDGATHYTLEISQDETFGETEQIITDIEDTTFTLENPLTPYSNYYWRVKAYGDATDSDYSEIWTFESLIGAPALRTPVDKAINMPIAFEFEWETVVGGKNYYLQISRFEDFQIAIFNERADRDTVLFYNQLEYNVVYYWRVRADDEDGNLGPWSEVWSYSTNIKTPILISPENNTGNVSNSINLTWERLPNILSYLQVAEDTDFNSIFAQEPELDDDKFLLQNLQTNKTYYWRVKFFVGEAESPWSEVWSFSTGMPRTTLLNPPNEEKGVSKESILFRWNSTPGAASYRLQVSLNNTFTNIFFQEDNIIDTRKDVYDFEPEMIYYWRVRANNEFGPNDWSETWNFTTDGAGSVKFASDFGIKIYPVPTEGRFSIDLPEDIISNIHKITLMSPTGQIVKIISYNRERILELNISELVSGTYYLSIDTKTNRIIEKITKIK